MGWKIKESALVAKRAGLKALQLGAEKILTEAIDEAPVESGTLRRSGVVSVGMLPDSPSVYEAAKAGTSISIGEGKEPAVYISFNTPYARRQHEELGYVHPIGGKPKYLEDPFNRNKAKVLTFAGLAIKKALRDLR